MTEEITLSENTRLKLRPARLRWSLRLLILGVTALAILFGWAAYERRIGQVHQEVGTQLALGFVAGQGLDDHKNMAQVRWSQETTRRLPVTPGYSQGGAGLASGYIEFTEKWVPPGWVTWCGGDLLVQRIESVQLVQQWNEKALDEALHLLAQLEPAPKVTINIPQMTEQQVQDALSRLDIDELTSHEARLSAGPMPWLGQSKLRRLDLTKTQFSNAAIDDLPQSLTRLILAETQVTDAGLSKFLRLRNLEYLDLGRTPTSREAIDQLRQEMSWCSVIWLPPREGEPGAGS